MPTVRWETRVSSPHYFYRSLERFEMGETVEDYKNLLMYLVAEAANENGGGLLTICLLALTILSVEEDLHKIRPSCMYPPAGFYPSGSADPFWKQHEDLFFFKFRFRLEVTCQLHPKSVDH